MRETSKENGMTGKKHSGRICYLHIGMPKTGTTSIQKALAGYDDGKISYCGFSVINHGLPIVTLFSSDPASFGHYKRRGVSSCKIAKKKAQFQKELEAELYEKTSHTIISGEQMLGALERDEIQHLINTLSPHYAEIQILVYVRPFLSYLQSAFQQVLKNGARRFDRILSNESQAYRRRLERWIEVVGAESITFVRFNRDNLLNGDVIDDFCALTGANPGRVKRERSNESLSAEAIAALYCFNKLNSEGAGRKLTHQSRMQLSKRARVLGNSRFSFSPELAEKLLANSKDDLDWMEKITGFSLRDTMKSNEVTFGSERDVLQYAGRQVPQLQKLLPGHSPLSGSYPARCAVLMQHLADLYKFDVTSAAPSKERTCYLHIGSPKTGTSAIQNALKGYDDGRVSYCGFTTVNHSTPMLMLFGENPENINRVRKIRNERPAV